MSDDALSQILRRILRLKKRPPATDAEVEEFWNSPPSDPESVRRIRARVAEKAFLRIHPKPIRQIRGRKSPSFAVWIAQARQKAELTRKDVATVLGQELSFLERLESGKLCPWEIDPGTIASLMQLYRIHFDAVKNLILNTEGSRHPSEAIPPSTPHTDDAQAALPDPSRGGSEFRPEVARWLEELQQSALTQHQPSDSSY